ncbi:MAG TPA: hypothetical protein VJ722_11775 [Rhodanobacteraceae bacterium]|nr:hypothetical protein [Rhodanobacteraceae bacterium]
MASKTGSGKQPGRHDPRKRSEPGYAEEQLRPGHKRSRLPGEGGTEEPHNKPRRKPGRGNG